MGDINVRRLAELISDVISPLRVSNATALAELYIALREEKLTNLHGKLTAALVLLKLPSVKKLASLLKEFIEGNAIDVGLEPRSLAMALAVMLVLENLGLTATTRNEVEALIEGMNATRVVRQSASYEIEAVRDILATLKRFKKTLKTAKPVVPQEYKKLEKMAETISRFVIKSGELQVPFGEQRGMKRIQAFHELKDMIPSERGVFALARTIPQLKPYAAYKLASRNIMVYERKFRVKPVIFIDFSDSMDSTLEENLTRYRFASALAIGLIRGAGFGDVYLFDSNIYKVTAVTKKTSEVERILLGETPRDGTSIASVLATIIEYDKHVKKQREKPVYVIITDAEDRVPGFLIDEIKKKGIDKRIIFLVVGITPYEEWIDNFKWVYVRDKETIKKAVLEIVKTIESTMVRPA